MMVRKEIDYASPEPTPVKKVPNRPWWWSKSPLKRVTKDLFGAKKSKLNNLKSSLFFAKTLNSKVYKVNGNSKNLKSSDAMLYNADCQYSKRMQEKDFKKPFAYKGLSVSEIVRWKYLETVYKRRAGARVDAKHRAERKAAKKTGAKK